jgi:hypothetical protein
LVKNSETSLLLKYLILDISLIIIASIMAESKFDSHGVNQLCARGGNCRMNNDVVLACTSLSTNDTSFMLRGKKIFLGPGCCLEGVERKQLRKLKVKTLPVCIYQPVA